MTPEMQAVIDAFKNIHPYPDEVWDDLIVQRFSSLLLVYSYEISQAEDPQSLVLRNIKNVNELLSAVNSSMKQIEHDNQTPTREYEELKMFRILIRSYLAGQLQTLSSFGPEAYQSLSQELKSY